MPPEDLGIHALWMASKEDHPIHACKISMMTYPRLPAGECHVGAFETIHVLQNWRQQSYSRSRSVPCFLRMIELRGHASTQQIRPVWHRK